MSAIGDLRIDGGVEGLASSLAGLINPFLAYPALEALGYKTSPLRGCSRLQLRQIPFCSTMARPFLFRGNLEIAPYMLLKACTARLAEKVTPTVGCAFALNEKRGANPLNTAEGTLTAGWTTLVSPVGECTDSCQNKDYRNDHRGDH